MNQWISAVNGYCYPYMIYHVSHERNVFPQLGIPSDENVVAHAIPKVQTCLQVLQRGLSEGHDYLVGSQPTFADFTCCRSSTPSASPRKRRRCTRSFRRSAHGASDGSAADDEAVPRRADAARADRARPALGRHASAELLSGDVA